MNLLKKWFSQDKVINVNCVPVKTLSPDEEYNQRRAAFDKSVQDNEAELQRRLATEPTLKVIVTTKQGTILEEFVTATGYVDQYFDYGSFRTGLGRDRVYLNLTPAKYIVTNKFNAGQQFIHIGNGLVRADSIDSVIIEEVKKEITA